MKAEIDVVGVLPEIIVSKTNGQVVIRCEIIEHPPHERPRQTGKFAHLGMTAKDAARLLALLKRCQQQFGWPDYTVPATVVDVPPEKERN